MLSFITWDVNPELFTILGREIRWYGLFWVVGLLVAVYIVQKIYDNEKLPQKWFDSLFVYMMLGIILGARIGHCLFYEPAYYLAHPLKILYIWEGGLASHGGVLGIIIAIWLYSRNVTKRSMIWTFDRVIVPTGFTAAMIRLGNLMNHEIYGGPTSKPWGFRFIENVNAWKAGAPAIFTEPSHPTQIYEALVYFLVFFVTMYLFWKTDAKKKQGLLIGIAMIMIFVARFFIEFIKEVQVPSELLMRQNTGLILGQWLSIPFILWGVWLVWNAFRNNKTVVQDVVVEKKKKDSNFITKK